MAKEISLYQKNPLIILRASCRSGYCVLGLGLGLVLIPQCIFNVESESESLSSKVLCPAHPPSVQEINLQ